MNKTQEIQYLGLMLTATTLADVERLAWARNVLWLFVR
ncbi:hypothetical protein LCGC14_1874530 [marine sediment metagenome]|uniref:Uncharacterized protein n=1 Tax=marine sediment metagenome TaxID=412755 RepID=A0A0F9G3Z3_9ZZZZ